MKFGDYNNELSQIIANSTEFIHADKETKELFDAAINEIERLTRQNYGLKTKVTNLQRRLQSWRGDL